MTRVCLTKYGFTRWPEKDFTDDSSRFVCYRAGKAVRVSKLVSNGQVYLSADSSVGQGTLPYKIYEKLPHYRAASWSLNGVSLDTLTEQNLRDFYEDCVLYEQEYEAMEASIKFPTTAEIEARCEELRQLRLAEAEEILQLLSAALPNLLGSYSVSDWTEVRRLYLQLLTTAEYNPNKVRREDAISFCASDYHALKPSWYYLTLCELLKKYQNS